MTGYTGPLVEQNMSFRDFTLMCARAMGYLIELRDESITEPLPEKLTPHGFYKDLEQRSQEVLDRIDSASGSERIALGETWKRERIEYLEKQVEQQESAIRKMEEMVSLVEAWHPPTDEHNGLKEFMLQQLHDSIRQENANWLKNSLTFSKRMEPEDYVLEQYQHSIASRQRGRDVHAEEIARYEKINRWLKALRDSLPDDSLERKDG